MPETIDKSQVERFRKIAQMIECGEDETRWDNRLNKIAKAKPAPEKTK